MMTHPAEQTAQAQFDHASETYKHAACKLQEKMLEAGGLRKFLIEKKYGEIVRLYRKLQELLKSYHFPEGFECEFGVEYCAWVGSGEGEFGGEFECLSGLLEREMEVEMERRWRWRGEFLVGGGEDGDGDEDGEDGDEFVVEFEKLMYALQSALQGLKELKGGEMVAPGVGKEEWGGGLIEIFAALEKIRMGAREMLGSERGTGTQMDGGSRDFEGLREEFQRILVTLVIHFGRDTSFFLLSEKIVSIK
ncbi:hypothetical protein ACHAPF_003295 [Botrytis cinerea]